MHVDKHGEPIFAGPPIIEWESNPVSVAYHQPYICQYCLDRHCSLAISVLTTSDSCSPDAISPTMIEIRDAFSGQLCQVITGSQCQLTYDGTAISSSANEARSPSMNTFASISSGRTGTGSATSDDHPDRRLHISMKQGAFVSRKPLQREPSAACADFLTFSSMSCTRSSLEGFELCPA